jgi:hypothetical protein
MPYMYYFKIWSIQLPYLTGHYYTYTNVYNHIFTSCCSVAASSGGRFPSSGFLNSPRATATSFKQQQLTRTEPQQSSNSLTNSLHSTDCLLITSWHGAHRKHRSNSSVVTSRSCGADRVENTASQFIWCVLPCNGSCLQSHYLTTGLHAAILL